VRPFAGCGTIQGSVGWDGTPGIAGGRGDAGIDWKTQSDRGVAPPAEPGVSNPTSTGTDRVGKWKGVVRRGRSDGASNPRRRDSGAGERMVKGVTDWVSEARPVG